MEKKGWLDKIKTVEALTLNDDLLDNHRDCRTVNLIEIII